MQENEFKKKIAEFTEKEKALDGSCQYEQKQGIFSKRWLEASGLYRMTGTKGKTRIVIEWDADTGTGWHRIVSESRYCIATHEHRLAHPRDPEDYPTDHSRCAE